MILLSILLGAALLVMSLFPETRLGRRLHDALVQRPAAVLTHFGLARTLALTAFLLFGLFLFWVGEAEGVRLFALMAPETLTWLALFDAGVMIDLIGLTLIAGGVGRLRPALDRARRMLARGATVTAVPARRAARAVRIVARRMTSALRNDADDRPAFGASNLQPAFG